MPDAPVDHEVVSAAIQRLLSRHSACSTTGPSPLTGGFDTYVYGLTVQASADGTWDGELVLRVYPSIERVEVAKREFAVQSWCVRRAYPAAEPLEVGEELPGLGLPYMIMRRAPGRTMLAALAARPWRALRLMHQLGDTHALLHRLDPGDLALGVDERPLSDRRLDDLRRRTAKLGGGYVDRMHWLEEHQGRVADEDPRVGHNDFHPMNLLIDDSGDVTVIDWANADIGDHHHDVARTLVTFHVAPLGATSATQRVGLRLSRGGLAATYRKAYERHLPLDPQRLRYWMALHALEGAAQVDQLHAGAFGTNTRSDSSARVPPALAGGLRQLFDKLTVAS